MRNGLATTISGRQVARRSARIQPAGLAASVRRQLAAGLATFQEYRGLARSLWMYYGDPRQVHRMRRFYARFIQPGDLSFDVGAHVGSRVPAWLRLGARIVAVEPHPRCMGLLRWLYGRQSSVQLVEQALGPRPGRQELLVCDREPTVSTLSRGWASTVKQARPNFAGVQWEHTVVVPVTTLDALIAAYGEPAFCKIDVEGYDLEVLRGLSRPLRALSFEYVPPALDNVLGCLDLLARLGRYQYNWSPGESMRLWWPEWVDAAELTHLLRAIPAQANPGDIYARLN